MSSPFICAVIGRTRHKMMQIEIQEAAKRGAKMIELRLDFLKKAPDFKRLLARRPCPLIATFRRPSDGGRWSGSEEERQMLIRQAIVAGFDYVDLEADTADRIPRFGKVKRIVSYHNLDETPDDLESIYERMCRQDADIVKIAVSGMQTADNVRVLKLLRNPPVPTIALCMGDLGTCTRILGAKFGTPFAYAAFNKERSFAPGMLSFHELQKVYQFEHINAETQVFGIVGDPVGHSLSPLIHNRAFQELGINAVYVPFRVPRGELPAFLEQMEAIPVQGYSVTIPHKEQAVKLAAEHGLAVDEIGAANTLIRIGDNKWKAHNTDFVAAVDSLQANLPTHDDGRPPALATRTVLVLGAGGVARAIAHGLKREGAALTISNRSHDRALKLAEEIGCKAIEWEGRHNILCDTLINCTSVGMFPNMDDSPAHTSILKPGLMVFDTIYTPETTLLIREAQERGCHVLTGVDMFVRQAAAQFQLFTGREAPLALMTDLVRRALSPVNYAKLDQEKEKPPPPDEAADTP
ncbi:MAG: shikimate dehydrogenase [Gemmataceae bacterium]|nr:shikimate dehydrogenase [Gemmataceae bacterium]